MFAVVYVTDLYKICIKQNIKNIVQKILDKCTSVRV